MTPEQTEQALKNDNLKKVMKEALKEWLDEKLTAFGLWSVRGVMAAALFALIYFILAVNGWQRGPGL